MAFGKGKKRESWSSRPLSMILPDNVKLFQRRGKSVMEKAIQDQSTKGIAGDITIGSPVNAVSNPLAQPASAANTFNASSLATTVEESAGERPDATKSSQASQTSTQVSEKQAGDVPQEAVPFLTLNLGETTDSLLDLSDQYSTMGPKGKQSQEWHDSRRNSSSRSISISKLNITDDSVVSNLTEEDLAAALEPGTIQQSSAEHLSQPATIPHATVVSDSAVGPMSRPASAMSTSTPTLPLPRSNEDSAASTVEQLSIAQAADLEPEHTDLAALSAGQQDEPSLDDDFDPQPRRDYRTANRCQHRANRQSIFVDSSSEDLPLSVDSSDVDPLRSKGSVRHSVESVNTKASEATPREEFILELNRKVIISRGVYIFDPATPQELAKLRLSPDELYNPFEFEQ